MTTLLTWLGNTDLRASEGSASDQPESILNALQARAFLAVHLFSDHGKQKTARFVEWLQGSFPGRIVVHHASLTNPTGFEEIYREAVRATEEIETKAPDEGLTFHLSPGTPAMAAICVLLAKTRYPAQLIESSREQGVKDVHHRPGRRRGTRRDRGPKVRDDPGTSSGDKHFPARYSEGCCTSLSRARPCTDTLKQVGSGAALGAGKLPDPDQLTPKVRTHVIGTENATVITSQEILRNFHRKEQ